jgi:hypothetical protein
MPARKILSRLIPILYTACVGVAYAPVGSWITIGVVLLAFLIWMLASQWPSIFPPSVALIISIGLGSVGLFVGAAPIPMLLSASLALASWDVILLDRDLTTYSGTPDDKVTGLLETRHYRSLVLAIGVGLLSAVSGRLLLHYQIPFCGMVLLMALGIFALEGVWRALAR